MKPGEILRQLEKFPQKKLGQNFLRDEKVLADIIAASELSGTDTVVEIGPGLGVLTEQLAKKAKRVIAIELDSDLAEYLRGQKLANTTIITGNALDIDWTVTIDGPYKVVANIPYSITSPLLRQIFSQKNRPSLIILLIQKEVAERILAEPGNRDRGFLTLLTEANATVKKVRSVKPGSFQPAPKVDSTVISLRPYPETKINQLFWPVIEAAFSHKRQTAVNAVATGLHLPKSQVEQALIEAGLGPMARPAVLNFQQWVEFSKNIEQLLKGA